MPTSQETTTMQEDYKHKLYRKILYLIAVSTFIHHVLADDAAVMAKLAKSLSPNPGWYGSNPSKWTGVQCDSSGRVSSISLNSKSISGELPSEINQLSNLKSLSLQNNQLSGQLPPLSNLSSLQQVYLDGNNFSSIPNGFLSGLTNLQNFSIGSNPGLPPWTIPSSLTDSSILVSFFADGANIIGPMPDIFDRFPSLRNVRLSYNNITGSLPPSLGKSGIQKFWINNQATGLSGRIDVIGSMSQLTEAWLHVNKFTGPIPDLSGCKNLIDIQLRDNQLTGVIPASLSSLPKLTNVSLGNNVFQGPVPSFPKGSQVTLGNTNSFCKNSSGPCDDQVNALLEVAGALGYPMAMAESWKGNDPCQDWRYISCESGSVTVINFAKQGFVGTISPAMANLTSLKSVILSDNNLTDTIPDSLTSLKNLQTFDVTNNNISGQVPKFNPSVTVKTAGNPLIGVNVPRTSPPGSSPTGISNPSSPTNEQKAPVLRWLIAGVTSGIAIVLAIVSFVIYKKCIKKWRADQYELELKIINKSGKKPENKGGTANASEIQTPSSDFDGMGVSISIQVLREVTNNFSEDNIVGEGGFGTVYKGQLHDGTQIAVKRMESAILDKGLAEFKAEIEVLTQVRHRNLVALHGFCVHGHERLLVYEYMPQGTLGQRLFQWKEKGIPPLTWKQRVSIALDVARGVEYLHNLAQQSFIHRDLKPSNILLGDDMRAKVSDFGLVKSAPDGRHSLETRLAGTFGYLAPEYAATGKVSTKVDVFAFGVILMEIMTGQKALDDTLPEERSHLVTWFRKIMTNNDNLRSSLDPSLETDEETFKDICKVSELALHCTSREPSQRPDMGHVVNVLSPLLVQWMPSSNDEEEGFGIDLQMSLPQALQRWKANDGKSTTFNTQTSEYSPAFTSTSKSSDVTSSTN